jgi:hypothetical protein
VFVAFQCICSGHDHAAVRNHGQEYGIHIGSEVKNVVVQGNITHGNREESILMESREANGL